MDLIEFDTLDAWLDARDQCICASDVPKLWGLYGSPLSLYHAKLHRERKEQNDAMRWGQLDQVNILRMAHERFGIATVELPQYASIKRCIDGIQFLATPDAITEDSNHVVECKSFSRMSDDALDSARLQVQAQLLICSQSTAHLFVRHANRPLYHELIEADATAQHEIVERSKTLWRCLQEQIPPEPIGNDYDIEALKALYPFTDDEMQINIPDMLLAEYQRIIDQIDQLEESKRELEANIRAVLGSAKIGIAREYIVTRSISQRVSPLSVPVQYAQRLAELSIPYRGGNDFTVDQLRVKRNKKGDSA